MMAFPVHENITSHLERGWRGQSEVSVLPVVQPLQTVLRGRNMFLFSCGSNQPFQFNTIPHDAVGGNIPSKIRGLLVHLNIFDNDICELVAEWQLGLY